MLTELRWIARVFFLVFVFAMISVTYLLGVAASPAPVVGMFFLLFTSGMTAIWAHTRVLDNEPVGPPPRPGGPDPWDGEQQQTPADSSRDDF